jgi:hypothetical protein
VIPPAVRIGKYRQTDVTADPVNAPPPSRYGSPPDTLPLVLICEGPTCASAPTLPRNNWPSDANGPTPHDPIPHPTALKRVPARHRTLRPNHKTTALSAVAGCSQSVELPLPRIPTSRSHVSRLPFQDSSPRSPVPSLAHRSVAAPTTASAFLQASLSKMARSNLSLPQHPAPRHFRSRLTTSRTRVSAT